MWFYEVQECLRPGFRVDLSPAHPGVQMGFDDEHNNKMVLPIGNSLLRLLKHPEDQSESFRLLWGQLEYTSAGFCITRQAHEDANADDRALVLIDGCHDSKLGSTKILNAWGRTVPELQTFTRGDGCKRELYLFKPGDGLFISWSGRQLDTPKPKQFVIEWSFDDANQRMELKQQLCQRARRRFRHRRADESTATSPPESRELRA